MEDKLIELLERFNLPVIRQGSLAPDEAYPDTFLTFWDTGEDEHAAYDNSTKLVDYAYMVNVYSTSPDRAYSLLGQVRTALKAEGWIITSRAYDAASDEITHVGRGMNVAFIGTEGAEG